MNKQNRNGAKNTPVPDVSLPSVLCCGKPVPSPALKPLPHPFKAAADKAT